MITHIYHIPSGNWIDIEVEDKRVEEILIEYKKNLNDYEYYELPLGDEVSLIDWIVWYD